MSKRVVIYRDRLLSYSETFIKKQALALTTWKPILLGHKFMRCSLPLDSLEVHLLLSPNASFFQRLLYMVRRRFGREDSAGTQTLKNLNADLIHAHFGTSAVDIWPYAKVLGIPMLVTLHGFDISISKEWWAAGNRGRRKRNYPQKLLALTSEPTVHFLAVSTAIKERAIRFGIPEEKITLSYIGVDADDFCSGGAPILERKKRILYVGRLVEKKGAPYLLDAFTKVKTEITDAELVIVGRGELEGELHKQVKNNAIQDVTFAGALSNLEVKEQIDQCMIFCLPSITAESGDAEGLPISILESQSSGVYVVTSSSGGINDNLLDGATCFCFEEKNSAQLADILIRVLRNPAEYLSIIDQQKSLVEEKFQLKNCTKELEALYSLHAKKPEDIYVQSATTELTCG